MILDKLVSRPWVRKLDKSPAVEFHFAAKLEADRITNSTRAQGMSI